MADTTTEKKQAGPTIDFRKKLLEKESLRATITEGLKSKSAKVRALAIKAAFKLKDHGFIKQNILSLINSDKSKKVLRAISSGVTRKDLLKKVRDARVKKKVATAEAKPEGAAPAESAGAKNA